MTSSIVRQTKAETPGGPAVDLAPFLGTVALAIAAIGVTGSSFMILAPLIIAVMLIGTFLWRGSTTEWIAGWTIGLGLGGWWLGPAISVEWVSWVGAGLVLAGLALVASRFRRHPLSTQRFDAIADRIADKTVMAVLFVLLAAAGVWAAALAIGVFAAMLGS